jgi:hypothetical protein
MLALLICNRSLNPPLAPPIWRNTTDWLFKSRHHQPSLHEINCLSKKETSKIGLARLPIRRGASMIYQFFLRGKKSGSRALHDVLGRLIEVVALVTIPR